MKHNKYIRLFSEKGPTVTLYHGTSESSLPLIFKTKRINGPAYFTPREDVAWDYAFSSKDPIVLKVEIPYAKLKIDKESYDSEPDTTIEDAIYYDKASVFSTNPISIKRIIKILRPDE